VRSDSHRRLDATSPRRDAWTALLLAAAGVGVRLVIVRAFPAAPRFDSQALIAFGRVFHDRGLFPDSYYWTHFGPGVPMILSLLDGVFAANIAGAARTATAIATGLLGVLPFWIWRSVLAYGWRLLAGLLLALWPGQVFFSGIVTQDNWVLLPGVALCALAVRVLRDASDPGRPIAATSLFLAAVAIRQEMLVVLLLPWLAASAPLVGRRARTARRNFALASALAVLGVVALAGQRFAATNRFTIATEHGGLALLGSVIPHSYPSGWISPRDYVAAVEPSLLGDPIRYLREASRLAWAEIRRHPLFQTLRAAAQAPRLALVSDASNLDWSMTLPGALPARIAARGERFRRDADLPLKIELGVIQGLSLAALVAGIWTRDSSILVVAAAAALKFAVHAVFAPVPRLVLPAIAFELLTIPLGAAALCAIAPPRRIALGVLAAAVPVLLLFLTPPLEAAVLRFPQEAPRLSRFSLAIEGAGGGTADCTLESGKLICLEPAEARLETSDADPSPGEAARVSCRLPPLADGETLDVRLQDTYAAGGWPDRMIARVYADGRLVFRRDLAAEPGSGWIDVPLEPASSTSPSPSPHVVVIEEAALRADAGMFWGASAPLGFAFRR
jgi:hypothetical protein